MFRRHAVNRRSKKASVPRTHALVERLEDKRLLSGTNNSASAQQTITAWEDVGPNGYDYSLSIEEIQRVDDEYWVVSRLHSSAILGVLILGVPPESTPTVTDSVTIDGPPLPVRHFRIGGFGGDDDPDLQRVLPTAVNSLNHFHEQLEGHSTELIYSSTDPALTAWRATIREMLIAEADEQYGELFGTEVEMFWGCLVGDSFYYANHLDSTSLSTDQVTFSATNVQVRGVDEGDIVETDGDYIYILSGTELVIVKAVDDANQTPEVVSRTRLMYRPQDMFLHDGRLTIVGTGHQQRAYHGIRSLQTTILPLHTRTNISVFDVSDPSQPSLAQESVVDGDYIDARAIGQDIYIVFNNRSGIPYLPTLNVVSDQTDNFAYAFEDSDNNYSGTYRYQTRDEYLRSLDQLIEQSSPPSAYRPLQDGQLERIAWLDDSFLEVDTSSRNRKLTSVLKFDTASTESGPVDNVSIPVFGGWSTTIYASENAIYLLTNETEQIANQSETFTRITKVSLTGEHMKLEASGTVKGAIDGQHSVDEHDGYLRVATTTGSFALRNSRNHLFVLQQIGDSLTVVGSAEDLAPTESIYSMRFDGDRAWMVTFRRFDPVYTFDLSDPANPQVTGELKIPGYSDYLQLIDQDHLLAIGRGFSGGRVGEVQISLFNIADMANPTLLYRYSFDRQDPGNSAALSEHHAFNYLPDRGLLVIPYSWAGFAATSRIVTFSIDVNDGIQKVGDVFAVNTVQRTVRIDDLLYGVTARTVSVVALDDPDTLLTTVELDDQSHPIVEHTSLLQTYLTQSEDVFIGRFHNADRDADHIILGAGVPPDNWTKALNESGSSSVEYEFQIRDAETNEIWKTIQSDGPLVQLQNPASNLLTGTELTSSGSFEPQTSRQLPDRISVQFRSRAKSLSNTPWSSWSQSQEVSVTSEKPALTSDESQPVGAFLLKWSKSPDRGRAVYENEPETSALSFETNAVSHYVVWITDATTRQQVRWDRDVKDTELDLSDLTAGKYWVWFRAAFEDGAFSDWSAGRTIRVLGAKPGVQFEAGTTLNRSPEFLWNTVSNASRFEVEITSPDSSETVYSEYEIFEARHQLTRDLAPGSYSFRVRAMLETDVYTQWSDAIEFTIAARPEITPTVDGFVWQAPQPDVESFEVWVTNASTGARVFYDAQSAITITPDVAEGGNATVGGFLKDNFAVGRYFAWVRANLADGSTSAWSARAVLDVVTDAISVYPPETLFPGQTQSISWQPKTGMDSYEVYIRRVGDRDATFRQSGITNASVALPDPLTTGDYKVWVRGTTEDGENTRWSQATNLTVSDQPRISVNQNLITWAAAPAADRFEIWINRVDEHGQLLTARIVHDNQLEAAEFDANTMNSGTYSVWVRSLYDTAEGLKTSSWSSRASITIAHAATRRITPTQRPLIDLFAGLSSELDQI